MVFRTPVDIPEPPFKILPCEPLLFVGSCFADNIGQRFREEGFPVTVNPFGTMYNPASVLHTIERITQRELPPSPAPPSASLLPSPAAVSTDFTAVPASLVFLTLGTNHIYRLKETGAIVDNCEKRPQSLFTEEILSVDECATYLSQTIDTLRQWNPDVRIVFTVSPIRYRKYGYHESQLSKATLLLAVEEFRDHPCSSVAYFPAYEIMMDELRDYRFYAPDMLHPSQQTVEYLWERLVDTMFSDAAKAFLDEWRPLKQILAHKPFNPDSEEYRALIDKTMLKVDELRKKYSNFAL
jgi:hypothetical protein